MSVSNLNDLGNPRLAPNSFIKQVDINQCFVLSSTCHHNAIVVHSLQECNPKNTDGLN